MDLFQFHSYCITLKSQLKHAWRRCPYIRQTCFQKYLLFLAGFLKLIQYFFESMLPVKKTNGNFALREISPYTLFFGFQIFFVRHETLYLEIPIFHNRDSLHKNEIHQYIHILHYQQYKGNIYKIRFYFLILSTNFGLNIGFVHSISCGSKTIFIVFSLNFIPKLSFNILIKESYVCFLSLNKTPSINPLTFHLVLNSFLTLTSIPSCIIFIIYFIFLVKSR